MFKRIITVFAAILSISSITAQAKDSPESMRKLAEAVNQELWNNHDISAIDRYFAKDYIQHSAGADGSEGLKAFATSFFKKFPEFKVESKRIIVENDILVNFSVTRINPQDIGQTCFDMLRVKNGKFVEHWDSCQDIPKERLNKNLPW
ncbi:nuclear transport factor 2 family protein [Hydromonas duriensis]|uniref:Putative SnoaL-like aldol condensation-catalyzing enzyme n=1 Tax=Hydromonas duriensis TaxID=1527608 RepID=A0A4R6Y1X5_9BURK|nr:ester cyclase [Hydromonas duriensis]TDR30225.1 putative SnoaL-like aldol condensation-catalyzing enzyme [Hydromonas duriensis]